VYIPPQAKANIHAPDDSQFPLMEKLKEFLESNQKVFLLLGDSGSGKSTFNRELENELWMMYKKKTGRIPSLHQSTDNRQT
jgi:type II secretory pathway predicted ATPase ExeA